MTNPITVATSWTRSHIAGMSAFHPEAQARTHDRGGAREDGADAEPPSTGIHCSP